MRASEKRMRRTVAAVGTKFPWLGNAARVEGVVRCALAEWRKSRPWRNPGRYDDARDIQSWSAFLAPLKAQDLRLIVELKPGEVRRRAKNSFYPFWQLSRHARMFFATQLSGRLIIKVARCRLEYIDKANRRTSARS